MNPSEGTRGAELWGKLRSHTQQKSFKQAHTTKRAFYDIHHKMNEYRKQIRNILSILRCIFPHKLIVKSTSCLVSCSACIIFIIWILVILAISNTGDCVFGRRIFFIIIIVTTACLVFTVACAKCLYKLDDWGHTMEAELAEHQKALDLEAQIAAARAHQVEDEEDQEYNYA